MKPAFSSQPPRAEQDIDFTMVKLWKRCDRFCFEFDIPLKQIKTIMEHSTLWNGSWISPDNKTGSTAAIARMEPVSIQQGYS